MLHCHDQGCDRTLQLRPGREFTPARAAGWGAAGSGGKSLAALRAPAIENLAAVLGRHASAKPVTALADQATRLKSAFHVLAPEATAPTTSHMYCGLRTRVH